MKIAYGQMAVREIRDGKIDLGLQLSETIL